MRKVIGYRGLLNSGGYESTAAICAEVRRGEYGWETMFKISDCSKTIDLSFADPEGADDERFQNDMDKLDTLIYACKEFQRGMRAVRRKSRS